MEGKPGLVQLCYCTICRKTASGGGYAINIAAEYGTLHVTGDENISVYQAQQVDEKGASYQSEGRRNFCRLCGSALWHYDTRWPELMHPFASAIDTELPKPPEKTHIFLASKPSWLEPCLEASDKKFDKYPEESIAAWHQRLGLEA
eukprot:jgi/Mesen1/4803/ME000243S03982